VGDPQMYVKVAANIDQLKAAMADARAEIRKVGDDTKGFADQFADRFEHLGERLAEYFAIREIAHFAEELLSGAHALELLALQTDINVERLQVLGAATQEYGLDSEKLGTLIFQLSRRIAGDDQSAAAALHMMGLTLDEVKGLNGEELFLTIARGLNTLQGNAVDLAATDLFGGRAGKSVIAFSKDVDGAMAAVKGSVSIASEESVKNLAAMEVQITRMQTSLHNWATQVVGEVAQGFNVLKDANAQGASKWEIFTAMVKDWATTSTVTGANTSHLTQLLLDHSVAANESATATTHGTEAHRQATVVLDARAQAQKFMAAVILDNAKPILDWQRQDLDQLREMGALTSKNAEAIGVNAAQLKLYEQSVKAADAASKSALAATKAWDEAIAHLTITIAERAEKQTNKEEEAYDARRLAAIMAETNAQIQLNLAAGRDAAGAFRVQRTALDDLNQALADLHARKVAGISQAKEEQVLTDAYTKALYDEAVAQDKVNAELGKVPPKADAADRSIAQFTNTLVLGVKNLDELNKALDDFYDQFTGNNGSIGTPGGGNVGTPGAQGMPRVRGAAHRAGGGPVSAGAPYIVGEVGPELFVPSTSGTIVPHGAGGVTVTVPITINGNVMSSEAALQRVVSEAVVNGFKNAGLRLPWRS
jgi:hypothetical protein